MSVMEPMPDFSEPSEGTRAVEVHGKTLYLPKGLSWDTYKGSWRITAEGKPYWRKNADEAWKLFNKLRDNLGLSMGFNTKVASPSGPLRSTGGLETGIRGVAASVSRTGGSVRLSVYVHQSINGKATRKAVVQSVVHQLDQEGIDDIMIVAAAMRATYERRQDEANGELDEPVTVDNYDIDLLPTEPVHHVWLTDVLQLAQKKGARV